MINIEKKIEDIENDIFIRKHLNIVKNAKIDRNKIIHAAHIEADLNPIIINEADIIQ